MSQRDLPNFLSAGEKIISSLHDKKGSLLITSSRIIYQTLSTDGKRRNVEDFDYKYLAHINCESKKGEDNRILGAVMAILGIAFAYMGQYYGYGATIVGVFFILAGIRLFFSKMEPRSILKIQMSGVTDTKTITMTVSASQMDEVLRSLSEMRERTKLIKGGFIRKEIDQLGITHAQ